MSRTPPDNGTPILSLKGISKRFGSVAANTDIDLEIYPGSVHAILGENGAGKSTLMSILAGRYRPDRGEIRLQGKRVEFAAPGQALAAGIGMVYQQFRLVESLSVVENIILGTTGPRLRLDLKAAAAEIRQFSETFGMRVDPRKKIWQLSMGERQLVEILKLLYRKARVLIFDEPTAVLSPPEIEAFFGTLAELAAGDHTILFITHKLEEVMRMADRITIMRRGRIMANLLPAQVRSRRELARLMVGREIVLRVEKPEVAPGATVLAARGLTAVADAQGVVPFTDVSLEVRQGEVLGLVGVAGNGQSPLVAALSGLSDFQAGSIAFLGKNYSAGTWTAAPKSDMAYIPEERHRTGSVPELDLTKNFLLTRLRDFGKGPLVDRPAARKAAAQAVERFGIAAPAGLASTAGQLSGGNLQKMILARELSRRPRLIIAEHPTQGLDVGATEEIWQALLAQRAHAAILLVSGDLKEVLSLSDRIAVMFRGRILRTLSAADPDEVSKIGLLMAGVNAKDGDDGP